MSPKKKKKGLATIHDLRTSIDARVHSLPHKKGQEFLDAYMTMKKMESLQRQHASMDKRREHAEEVLRDMYAHSGDMKLADMIREELEDMGLPADTFGGQTTADQVEAEKDKETKSKHPFPTVKITY